MALSSKATLQFQNKLIKNILLSILVPSFIIMVSAWYFFGDKYMSAGSSKVKNTNYCEGAIEETCDKSICSWDPTAKRPDSDKLGMCVALH